MEKARTKSASDAVSIEDDERHVDDVGDYIRRNRDALNASIGRSRNEIAKGKHSKKSVRESPALCDMLGAMTKNGEPSELDVVALLTDRPKDGLAGGRVGTVVEPLDTDSALVEFSDDKGRAYAVVPCAYGDLMVLHYFPQVA